MKIRNSFVDTLIKEDDPFPEIFDYLLREIWKPQSTLQNYYAQEKEMTDLERFLTRTYDEFFTEVLPARCSQVQDIFVKTPAIYLDSLSLREGVLLSETLSKEGYQTSLSYAFSAVPSVTTAYKTKINLKELQKSLKYAEIKDLSNYKIEGDEGLIWSSFPDALFESLASGKTVLDSIENAYKTVERLTLDLVETLDHKSIYLRSDHGYVRHQPAYSMSVDKGRKQIREAFGGGRYIAESKAGELNQELHQFIVQANDYYLAKSQYVWPVAGKYQTLQHGGVSLMECLTPVLEVRK